MREDRTERMREIRDEVVALKNSPLAEERRKQKVFPVIGEGSHEAPVMFIGEAPGRNEAATGRPFCGAAGAILDELLESIGVQRKEVYVTNVVKDRPPGNRDPYPDEIALYAPFLDRQIQIIRPKVIATLGRFAMAYVMNRYGLGESVDGISRIHGNSYETDLDYGKVRIVPLFHPAVAAYNAETKSVLRKDFQRLQGLLVQLDILNSR